MYLRVLRNADFMPEQLTPQRILLVITTLTFGGAETQVVRLAQELKRRGREVAIACLLKPSNWVEQLTAEGIAVHSLDMKRGVPDVRAIARLCRLVETFRPDVVHSHMVHANLLARAARLFCRMPVLISTAHNLRETSEKGGPTWYKEVLYRLSDFLADRTTIICHAAYKRYVEVGAVPAAKFEVVPNGIDVERFSPSLEARVAARKSLGLADSVFLWLAVGRLVEQKDYLTLLRALEILPEGDYKVLVAGSGPLLEPLKQETQRLQLEDKIQFLGASENIRHLYAAADAFVMSSIFEGLSAALLEASAMALPAVVTDVGGNTEIVTDGETGFVVRAQDPQRLAEAMQRLAALTPEARAQLGAAARAHCLRNYRFDFITDQWLDLYARCLARTPERPKSLGAPAVGSVTR
jgi:glycosyltransferase involved in cell wall biosynthesis